jgi:DNA-binding transcriptional LysR family regulator
LFHRTTRSIQPTDEGQRLFAQAQQLLEMVETFEDEWGEKAEPSGTIRITASASFARVYLMPLIPQLLRRYPNIHISFELSDKVVDIVAEGMDIAIRGAQMHDSSLIARKLGPSPEVLCATRAYLENAAPLTAPADLVRHNCIVLNENYNWEFRHEGKALHQKVSGNFQTNYSEALVAAIKDGLGLGMVCYWQIHEELMAGELELVLPAFEPGRNQSIYAVYPSRATFAAEDACADPLSGRKSRDTGGCSRRSARLRSGRAQRRRSVRERIRTRHALELKHTHAAFGRIGGLFKI